MYKLFLCLRYLRSRAIAYAAMVGVALCVAMMLIVISVMNGFLNKIESAARGLFGDMTVASTSLGGIARYDEFIAKLKREVPDVQSATPFIYTVGMLRIPGNDWRQNVQIAGIRLSADAAGRLAGETMGYFTDVSDFSAGLYMQKNNQLATFAVSDDMILKKLAEDCERTRAVAAGAPGNEATERATMTALVFHDEASQAVAGRPTVDVAVEDLKRVREEARSAAMSQAISRPVADKLRKDAIDAMQAAMPYCADLALVETLQGLRDMPWNGSPAQLTDLAARADDAFAAIDPRRVQPPDSRAIIGLGIPGLAYRTPDGQTIRRIMAGNNIVLMLVPLGRKAVGASNITPASAAMTVVDDCRTDISSIDSNYVYVPFETLQKLNDMDSPARCSQVLIKVAPSVRNDRQLMAVRDKIEKAWNDFRKESELQGLPVVDRGADVIVQTWRERLADAVEPIQQQRTLAVIMFGIISLVALVLIFVIFYMIVVQKTRDIGVMKAVGASGYGVAGLFLSYGAAVGLVGSIVGVVSGWYFVLRINDIQNAMDKWFGFRVWRKEVFLFERIPNEVDPWTTVAVVACAIAAGLLGAMIPAVRAARMQPVEALRYE